MKFTHIVGIVVLIFCACTDRDRDNPLDPKNPNTSGRPTGFTVYSIEDTIYLRWDAIALNDLMGYQIYRKMSGESEFSRYTLVAPETNSFKDSNVQYNQSYDYRLTALGPDFESVATETVEIQPGPTINWVISHDSGQLAKLTHDAQHQILRTAGFYSLVDVEPNSVTGEVWVLERYTRFVGNALRVSPLGRIQQPTVPFTGPVDVAIDLSSNSIWIADQEGRFVAKLDSIGGRQFTNREFLSPVALDVDQRNGTCWVADRKLRRIARVNKEGSPTDFSAIEFVAVQSVTVNSVDGSVWVADSTRVIKVNENGGRELELDHEFQHAYKIAVNENTGDIWVVDRGPSTLLKFSNNGAQSFEMSGFSEPHDLAVNPFDQSCLVADTENARLVKVSASGEIVSEFTNINSPYALGIQYRPPQ